MKVVMKFNLGWFLNPNYFGLYVWPNSWHGMAWAAKFCVRVHLTWTIDELNFRFGATIAFDKIRFIIPSVDINYYFSELSFRIFWVHYRERGHLYTHMLLVITGFFLFASNSCIYMDFNLSYTNKYRVIN